MRLRTTKGINLIDYQPFTIVDDWSQPDNSHRILKFPWVGSTLFQEVADTVTLIDTTSSAQRAAPSRAVPLSSIVKSQRNKKQESSVENKISLEEDKSVSRGKAELKISKCAEEHFKSRGNLGI